MRYTMCFSLLAALTQLSSPGLAKQWVVCNTHPPGALCPPGSIAEDTGHTATQDERKYWINKYCTYTKADGTKELLPYNEVYQDESGSSYGRQIMTINCGP
jgi:hypothetical protein